MSDPMPISKGIADRLRAYRRARRLTCEQMAGALTEQGYPITRAALANIENGRFKTLPADLLHAALKIFSTSPWAMQSFVEILEGPLCSNCHDMPPKTYICVVCGKIGAGDEAMPSC